MENNSGERNSKKSRKKWEIVLAKICDFVAPGLIGDFNGDEKHDIYINLKRVIAVISMTVIWVLIFIIVIKMVAGMPNGPYNR